MRELEVAGKANSTGTLLLDEQSSIVSRLTEMFGMLEQRLLCIALLEPVASEEASAKERALPSFLSGIRSNNADLVELASRVDRLITAIEI